MPCTYCNAEAVLARGLCQACYHRLRRGGSVQRTYVINSGKCSVDGCDGASFAKNLCQSHYTKAQHPMKTVWKLLRSRYPGQFPKSWDVFDVFLSDVGARPTPKHQLRRADHAKPYSKNNVRWVEPVSLPDHMSKEDRSAYGREWNLRRYKIDGEYYAKLLNEQGGVCAICGGKETHTYKSGKLKELSVDHCHDTGKVRGLLCVNCNRGLGYFADDIGRIKRAIDYLRKSKV
jgi:hypothetical protein